MAVNQVTLAQLLSEAQAIGISHNALFHRVQLYAALVISIGVAGLQAAPYNMTSGDATTLFNFAQDQDNLRKVYGGLMYVTAGGTLNTGVPLNNDATHFGYPFNISANATAGLGY